MSTTRPASDYRQAALILSSAAFLLFHVPTYAATENAKLSDNTFQYRQTMDRDTLWKISRVLKTQGVSVNQLMVATLRQNPDAFIRGNVCSLKKGVTLTIPGLAAVQAEPASDADALVQAHEAACKHRAGNTPPLYGLKGETNAKPAPVSPISPATPPAPPAVTEKPAEPAQPAQPTQPAPVSTPESTPAPVAAAPATPTADSTGGFAVGKLLPWLGGLLALIAGFFALRLFGKGKSGDSKHSNKRPRVEVSDEGLRNVRVLESIETTAAMVHGTVPEPPATLPPPASDAELKLRMAEAYLDMSNKDAARAILNEVLQEGGSEAKARAHELLARCV
jgi:pilus assembly protein FimV